MVVLAACDDYPRDPEGTLDRGARGGIDRDKLHPAIGAATATAMSVSGVRSAEVKLREEGHLITGAVYAELADEEDVIGHLDKVRDAVEASDWRLYDIVVTPVRPGEL